MPNKSQFIPKPKKTQRGFPIYCEFKDTYGGTVRLQMSSAVEKRLWVFYDHPENGKMGVAGYGDKPVIIAPHLDEHQARQVMLGLKEFLRDF